jgi:hypothetical protein
MTIERKASMTTATPMNMFIQSLYLAYRLTALLEETDRRGELYKGHKLLRITRKSWERFKKYRGLVDEREWPTSKIVEMTNRSNPARADRILNAVDGHAGVQ